MLSSDGLAQELARHYGLTTISKDDIDDEDWIDHLKCDCGKGLGDVNSDGGEVHNAHLAEVALAWVRGELREEWGVQYECDTRPYETGDDRDYLFDEYITGVYLPGETPPKLMRRFVTDWVPVTAPVEGDRT